MFDHNWFVINDIKGFADKARIIVYSNFGEWNKDSELEDIVDQIPDEDMEELDKILSYNEAITIISDIARKQTNKKTHEKRYLINDDLFADIIKDLNTRMVSNILNNLVNKGLVETSYDSEADDFIFWVKEEHDQKPETD